MKKFNLMLVMFLILFSRIHGQWQKATIYGSSAAHPDSIHVTDFAKKGDTVFALTTAQGIYYSQDEGLIWDRASDLPIYYPNGGPTIFAKGSSIFIGNMEGIFKSVDGGASWYQVESENAYIQKIINTGNRLIAVSSGNMGINYTGGVLISDDGGENWELSN